jgi:hypothetical protein
LNVAGFTDPNQYADALQIAIWSLLTNNNTSQFQYLASTPDVSTLVTDYLNAASGKSEDAIYLDAMYPNSQGAWPNGAQSMIATANYNFSNSQHHQLVTPTIVTNQGPTVVLGSGNPLTDSATLSNGASPTGTIAFNLYAPSDTTYSSPIYTTTVTVNGNGVYGGASYVPTAANGTGTFEWVATYSGDGNNLSVNSGQGNEPETVSPASPQINTTPGGTVSIGNITISGTKYTDITGNGFSADDTPLGGVTINLYQETDSTAGLQVGSGGDKLVATTTTANDGTYGRRPDRRRTERQRREHLLHHRRDQRS